MHKFTIDRATWRTGDDGNGPSCLKNIDGFKCCLGFYAESLGQPTCSLNGSSLPGLESHAMVYADKLDIYTYVKEKFNLHLGAIQAFYQANDSTHAMQKPISRACRELKLTELFKDHDIEVTFTGEYP